VIVLLKNGFNTNWPRLEQCIVTVLGDKYDPKGVIMREELELWIRHPVECIKDLMQNPAFKNSMAYAPECVYRDVEGKK
jgi:hypothetical protein